MRVPIRPDRTPEDDEIPALGAGRLHESAVRGRGQRLTSRSDRDPLTDGKGPSSQPATLSRAPGPCRSVRPQSGSGPSEAPRQAARVTCTRPRRHPGASAYLIGKLRPLSRIPSPKPAQGIKKPGPLPDPLPRDPQPALLASPAGQRSPRFGAPPVTLRQGATQEAHPIAAQDVASVRLSVAPILEQHSDR